MAIAINSTNWIQKGTNMKKQLSYIIFVIISLSLNLNATEKIKLAENKQALSYIVTDDKPEIWSDRFAAEELAAYLQKITGASFKTIKAGEEKEEDSCIYLSNIAAKKLGIDRRKLNPQELIIKIKDNDVFITGGMRDGTLSAVYYFLENFAGLRFWNMKETLIPETADLTVPACDIRKTPDFIFRGCQGMENPDSLKFGFDCLTKVLENGKWKRMRNFRDRAKPVDHGLVRYYVKKDMFKTHPEWFAEINGKRTLAANDLCLTNPDLPEYVAQKLIQQIKDCYKVSKKEKIAVPFIYSIAREDNARWCQCPACKEFAKKHRKSGLIVNFINQVAKKVHDKYPNIIISTLAYQSAAAPPINIIPEDNVAVQYCFEKRNLARPLTDKSNKKTLDQLTAWAKISKNLFIWDYAMSFGKFHNKKASYHDFPVPSILHMGEDLRLCRKLGVKGVYVQNPSLEERDLWGLKNWVLSKLYFDSSLDEETLVKNYLKGYYGPAWQGIWGYIQALVVADKRKPSRIWFYADLAEYKYFDLQFFKDANKAFNTAEKAVSEAPLYLERVNAARFTLTRTMFFCYTNMLRNWIQKHGSKQGFPYNADALLSQLKEEYKCKDKLVPCGFSCISGYKLRSYPYSEFLKDIPRYKALTYYKQLPIPEKFKTINKLDIYDYPAGIASIEAGKNAVLINDSSVPAGKTVEVSIDITKQPLCWKFKPRWGAAAWEYRPNSDKRKQIDVNAVKGKGYHWYNLGAYYFEGTSTGLLFFDNDNIKFWADRIGKFDVWAHIKFENPALPFCDKKVKSSVSISRIIMITPDKNKKVYGNCALPNVWKVFPGFTKNHSINEDLLKVIPDSILFNNKPITPINVNAVEGKADLANAIEGTEDGKTAFVYIPFDVAANGKSSFGFGADWWLTAWIDGRKVCDTSKRGNGQWPPTIKDHLVDVNLTKGKHLLVIKFISGSGSSVLAVGDPGQIRKNLKN